MAEIVHQSRFHIVIAVLMTAIATMSAGCSKNDKPSSSKSAKPAKVDAHPNEADIYRITLTPEAVKRLQISTALAVQKPMPRIRSLGGDIVIPDGKRISVMAPLTGKLLPADDTDQAVAGQQVEADQTLFRLIPWLPPQQEVPTAAERVQMANAQAALVTSQVQADGDMKQAAAQVEGAKIAFTRAKQLLIDRAGSQRQVDEAEAALNVAREAQKAAAERKALLDRLTLEAGTGEAQVIDIQSPHEGILQTVSASTGQVVNAGTPLFEIVNLQQMWVRVPVYAGLVNEIDASASASVSGLSALSEKIPARPMPAPPTATALSASVDLYYSVDNRDSRFRPGERVTVRVPLKGETESLVVPRAAVLRDIYGTGWVYIQSGENEFRRERVAVTFTTEEFAVLSLGPQVGAAVVVDGAAELFGTEFGAGK